MKTYFSLWSAALANKIANRARKHLQSSKQTNKLQVKGNFGLLFFFFLRVFSFFSPLFFFSFFFSSKHIFMDNGACILMQSSLKASSLLSLQKSGFNQSVQSSVGSVYKVVHRLLEGVSTLATDCSLYGWLLYSTCPATLATDCTSLYNLLWDVEIINYETHNLRL